ncbi:5515_t:CDS:1 [Paraglomus brasilianum]|uniref:5515_t:CDS:1 n=1 Tax=Paraglomus brasilianum TaxID=144538 RepID=A0A9N8VWC8_9GLOM|nr:5515_t:CDS:1 [Paraglomus brasilianum]
MDDKSKSTKVGKERNTENRGTLRDDYDRDLTKEVSNINLGFSNTQSFAKTSTKNPQQIAVASTVDSARTALSQTLPSTTPSTHMSYRSPLPRRCILYLEPARSSEFYQTIKSFYDASIALNIENEAQQYHPHISMTGFFVCRNCDKNKSDDEDGLIRKRTEAEKVLSNDEGKKEGKVGKINEDLSNESKSISKPINILNPNQFTTSLYSSHSPTFPPSSSSPNNRFPLSPRSPVSIYSPAINFPPSVIILKNVISNFISANLALFTQPKIHDFVRSEDSVLIGLKVDKVYHRLVDEVIKTGNEIGCEIRKKGIDHISLAYYFGKYGIRKGTTEKNSGDEPDNKGPIGASPNSTISNQTFVEEENETKVISTEKNKGDVTYAGKTINAKDSSKSSIQPLHISLPPRRITHRRVESLTSSPFASPSPSPTEPSLSQIPQELTSSPLSQSHHQQQPMLTLDSELSPLTPLLLDHLEEYAMETIAVDEVREGKCKWDVVLYESLRMAERTDERHGWREIQRWNVV